MDWMLEAAEGWGNPAIRHAMLVHFPIVLGLLGIPLVGWLAVSGGRPPALRWSVLAVYALAAAAAYAASQSGEDAEHAVEGAESDAAHEVLEEHEELGSKLWMFAAATGALVLLTNVTHRPTRLSAAWLALAGGLVTGGWTANTAHHGGLLVYEHALGPATVDLGLPGAAAAAGDPRVVHFEQHVVPVLRDNCWKCHNPRRQRRSGGLDQTSIAGLLTGGYSGPAIVPGRPEESLLIQAVRHEVEDLEMPPSGDELPEDAVEALVTWIRDGAVWRNTADATAAGQGNAEEE